MSTDIYWFNGSISPTVWPAIQSRGKTFHKPSSLPSTFQSGPLPPSHQRTTALSILEPADEIS